MYTVPATSVSFSFSRTTPPSLGGRGTRVPRLSSPRLSTPSCGSGPSRGWMWRCFPPGSCSSRWIHRRQVQFCCRGCCCCCCCCCYGRGGWWSADFVGRWILAVVVLKLLVAWGLRGTARRIQSRPPGTALLTKESSCLAGAAPLCVTLEHGSVACV